MALPLIILLLAAVIYAYVHTTTLNREVRDRNLARIQRELAKKKIEHAKKLAAEAEEKNLDNPEPDKETPDTK